MNKLINGGNTSLLEKKQRFSFSPGHGSSVAWSLVKRAWACDTEINCI